MVYDPNQKTLNADRGEIRVGGKYQAEVPSQRLNVDGMEEGRRSFFSKNNLIQYSSIFFEENPPTREELIWNANGGLTEKQIEQFLIVARYFLPKDFLLFHSFVFFRSIGTFARALDCPTALKHPSLHMSAASASRDATLVDSSF